MSAFGILDCESERTDTSELSMPISRSVAFSPIHYCRRVFHWIKRACCKAFHLSGLEGRSRFEIGQRTYYWAQDNKHLRPVYREQFCLARIIPLDGQKTTKGMGGGWLLENDCGSFATQRSSVRAILKNEPACCAATSLALKMDIPFRASRRLKSAREHWKFRCTSCSMKATSRPNGRSYVR